MQVHADVHPVEAPVVRPAHIIVVGQTVPPVAAPVASGVAQVAQTPSLSLWERFGNATHWRGEAGSGSFSGKLGGALFVVVASLIYLSTWAFLLAAW